MLKGLIDNSLVAVSKLLHFVRPDLYAIWDSRVYTYVNGSYSQYLIQMPRNYLAFLDNCGEIIQDGRFRPVHASMNQKIGYEVSPLRALELVMYWHTGAVDLQNGRKGSCGDTASRSREKTPRGVKHVTEV